MRVKGLLRLLAFWGVTGFALGTATLLGPLRWIVSAQRGRDVPQVAEDWTVRAIMLVLAAGTFFLARWLSRRWEHTTTNAQRAALAGIPAVAAAGALALWLSPTALTQSTPIVEGAGGDRVVFGPYPTDEMLVDLKAKGYAGVITLLHPAVVPFEPKLLGDERRAAKRVGMQLIEAPLLPWVGDNSRSLGRIDSLLTADPTGRYYVHCYLGRDRVRVVARLVAKHAGTPGDTIGDRADRAAAGGGADVVPERSVLHSPRLERGRVTRVGDVVVGPLPTDEEWFGYVLNGGIRQVVSLLDPKNPEDVQWIERGRAVAAEYRIPWMNLPLPPDAPASQAREVVAKIRALPGPVFVHAFRFPSPTVDALLAVLRAPGQ